MGGRIITVEFAQSGVDNGHQTISSPPMKNVAKKGFVAEKIGAQCREESLNELLRGVKMHSTHPKNRSLFWGLPPPPFPWRIVGNAQAKAGILAAQIWRHTRCLS